MPALEPVYVTVARRRCAVPRRVDSDGKHIRADMSQTIGRKVGIRVVDRAYLHNPEPAIITEPIRF